MTFNWSIWWHTDVLSNSHLVPLFQGLLVRQNVPFFPLEFSGSRFILWTWKPEKCVSAAIPSLASGFSPQIPALPSSYTTLKDHELVTPWIYSVAKSASKNLPYQNPQILSTSPAQHLASTESSPGLKHVRSQGIAANSRGPETKHHWDESQLGLCRSWFTRG